MRQRTQKRDRKMRGDGWIRVVDGDLHLCIPQRKGAREYVRMCATERDLRMSSVI